MSRCIRHFWDMYNTKPSLIPLLLVNMRLSRETVTHFKTVGVRIYYDNPGQIFFI